MIPLWFIVLCAGAVISISLVSGLFLIFSDFLMRSLKLSLPAAGIEVMQVINREIWKSITMVLLWGNLALTVGLAGYASLSGFEPASQFLMLGAALYFFGSFVISFAANVPMNNRLADMDHAGSVAAAYWTKKYLPRWVFWNYIRALATGGAAILFLAACLTMARV